MKKLLLSLVAVLCACVVLCSCSKAQSNNPTNANGETTYPQTSSVLYDRNGTEYAEKSQVNYYDADGNIYHFTMDQETYLPSFVDAKTGEKYDAFFCYISEDGYLVMDFDHKIDLNEGSTDTYHDDEGNTYYDISTVEWDKDGNLVKL